MAAVATPQRPRVAAQAALEALTADVVRHCRAVGGGTVPPALIEAIRLRLGRALAERYSQAQGRMPEQLDVIKRACKDLCPRSSGSRWMRALSADPVDGTTGLLSATSPVAVEAAADHLHLPCALVRGALQALGVDCTVSADPSHLPAVDFTIVIRQMR